MRRVNYFLTVRQIERIEALAARSGLDRSAIIRTAIDAHLDREEKRAKREDEG